MAFVAVYIFCENIKNKLLFAVAQFSTLIIHKVKDAFQFNLQQGLNKRLYYIYWIYIA